MLPARSRGVPVLSALAFGCLACGPAGGNRDVVPRVLACDPGNGGLSLPAGFCAVVVADDLGPARHLDVTAEGDVYVAMQRTEAAAASVTVLQDRNGDGTADIVQRFGDHFGTGIEVHDGFLYVSSNTAVFRYPMTAGQLRPNGPAETIVEGFPEQRTHAAKPLAFDETGGMYVTVGAPSNACQEADRRPGSPGLMPCPQREWQAGIWRFDAARAGQTQREDGRRFASGIRHAVAIAWNPFTRSLYAVQHGRDQLDTIAPSHFDATQNAELPSEELLLVGEGEDFGWPYCYHDPVRNRRVLAPEYGGDGTAGGDCAKYAEPLAAFPAHWAPNDLLFYRGTRFPARYREGAFIAFHGSWNRAPERQGGYLVAFVPMAGGRPAGEWEVFADGFAGREVPQDPRDAIFRPMGLAEGPDGSLYISDSQKGRIWRVHHPGTGSRTSP